MENYSMNPLKQNFRLKQYIGWFVALSLPFAAKHTADISGIPLIPALIYWFVCGILLRLSFERKLPYFKPQIKVIKKEFFLLFSVTVLSIIFLLNNHFILTLSFKDSFISYLLFAIFNGIFEPLVWSNIFSLSGCKIKLSGFAASFMCASLMLIFFWQQFMPSPTVSTVLFMVIQAFMFIIPLIIYIRTKDLTLWSIQRIIYNLVIIFLASLL